MFGMKKQKWARASAQQFSLLPSCGEQGTNRLCMCYPFPITYAKNNTTEGNIPRQQLEGSNSPEKRTELVYMVLTTSNPLVLRLNNEDNEEKRRKEAVICSARGARHGKNRTVERPHERICPAREGTVRG
jgi:hypothetical protein